MPIVSLVKDESVDVENLPCILGHTIDGVFPKVDEDVFEIQNPQYIGRKCDCGNLTYAGESTCGCSVKKWRIDWE